MGFFKEFKEDLSQAVNELGNDAMPNTRVNDDSVMVNTLDEKKSAKANKSRNTAKEITKKMDSLAKEDAMRVKEDSDSEQNSSDSASSAISDTAVNVAPAAVISEAAPAEAAVVDGIANETAIFTKSLQMHGNIVTDGSAELHGILEGDIRCKGKLVVTGTITGDASANEVLVNGAQIAGDIKSDGLVRIGQGSVIIGNISGKSAVIAGAVKGNIDINGPVIVDASAIIAGDIKSRTMQINSGSVIEGHCSQCYAEVTPTDFFNR